MPALLLRSLVILSQALRSGLLSANKVEPPLAQQVLDVSMTALLALCFTAFTIYGACGYRLEVRGGSKEDAASGALTQAGDCTTADEPRKKFHIMHELRLQTCLACA